MTLYYKSDKPFQLQEGPIKKTCNDNQYKAWWDNEYQLSTGHKSIGMNSGGETDLCGLIWRSGLAPARFSRELFQPHPPLLISPHDLRRCIPGPAPDAGIPLAYIS